MGFLGVDSLFTAVALAAPIVVSVFYLLHPAAACWFIKVFVFSSAAVGCIGYLADSLGFVNFSHALFVISGLFQLKS